MTQTMNIAEAKGKLSALVAAALAGETVELSRSGKPVIRLVPILAPQKRRIGILKDYGWSTSTPLATFDHEPDNQIDTPFVTL